MALIKCKECGQEVSKKAGSCPKCGAPIKKKTSLITWIVAIIIVLWVIGYIANQGNTPSETSSTSDANSSNASKNVTTKIYKIGETAHVGYTSYAVWKAFYKKQLSDNPYLNQPPDATYLFVDITVRNDDTKARSIAPFMLVDDKGSEYETSSNAWSVDGSIGVLDSLNPGVQKRGYIVFDVPRGKHYKLEISGGYWSSDKALIDLGLK
jgi:Domain of unknown function (DUF4352)